MSVSVCERDNFFFLSFPFFLFSSFLVWLGLEVFFFFLTGDVLMII